MTRPASHSALGVGVLAMCCVKSTGWSARATRTGRAPRAAPNGTRSAVAPHAPPAQTNPAHLGYGCTGWESHLSIESNGPQRISVSHPGSHFGRFRRPAGYGVMGGRPRRSPHPQEVPQAGSAAQRRPAGARGAGRWPRVVAGRAGAFRGFGERRNACETGQPGNRATPGSAQAGLIPNPPLPTQTGPFTLS